MSAPQGSSACHITVDPSMTDIGADRHHNAIVMTEIHQNRHGVEALNRIFDAYNDTITT